MNRKNLIVALTACLVIIAVVAITAHFSGFPPSLTPTSTPSTTPAETNLPTSCVVGDFNVTVIRAEWTTSLDGYTPERENGKYLLVNLSVENTGHSSRLFGVVGEYFGATGSAEVVVIDDEGYEYPSFRKVPLPGSEMDWTVLPQMVDPCITMEWTIAFDLPGDAAQPKLALHASKSDDWTMLKLDIREAH